MIRVAVIGCGYWGPHYLRVFNELEGARTSLCCDLDAERLVQIKARYPSVGTTTNHREILLDQEIDAVCISTSASSHYELAKECLTHGKHVLVEKPMALSVKDAEELVSTARKEGLILMVGHIYLYHPAVQRIKRYLTEAQLEDLYYLYSVRTGLGPIRADTNALWDLAPHDISMFLYLLDRMPINVSARGASYLQHGIEDVVSLSMEFPGKAMGYAHVSWLDPYKLRRLTIVSKDKMILFDDASSDEKLKILDQGFLKRDASTYGEFLLEARRGDIHVPRIEPSEPLRSQCMNFIECIRTGGRPLADGEQGLKIVRVLEAAQRSLDNLGVSTDISP